MILKLSSVKTPWLQRAAHLLRPFLVPRYTSTSAHPTFNDLHIDRRLVVAAREHLGVTQPTPMQHHLLTALSASTQDILLRHSTGSGKTLTLLLWLLTQALHTPASNTPTPRPFLFLVPNRELALQLEQWTHQLLSGVPGEPANVLQRFVSGTEYSDEQLRVLEKYGVPRVVLGTPRCLLEHAEYANMVGSAGCVVVDEVDAVLRLPGKNASDRQIRVRREKPRPGQLLVDRLVQGEGVRLVLSSATANKELRRFLRRWTRHIELVDLQKGMHVPDTLSHHCLVIEDRQTIRNIREKEAEPKETPEQEHYHHNGQLVEQQQQEYLEAADVLAEVAANVIEQMRARRTIMFIRSDAPTRQFLAHLADHGVHALELAKRYSAKREEGSAVYLATEEAARGIDISDVDLVLILDVPRGPASYAHLAGRTGRFGRSGAVVSVVPVGAWGFYESKMRGMYKALGLTPTKLDFVD